MLIYYNFCDDEYWIVYFLKFDVMWLVRLFFFYNYDIMMLVIGFVVVVNVSFVSEENNLVIKCGN